MLPKVALLLLRWLWTAWLVWLVLVWLSCSYLVWHILERFKCLVWLIQPIPAHSSKWMWPILARSKWLVRLIRPILACVKWAWLKLARICKKGGKSAEPEPRDIRESQQPNDTIEGRQAEVVGHGAEGTFCDSPLAQTDGVLPCVEETLAEGPSVEGSLDGNSARKNCVELSPKDGSSIVVKPNIEESREVGSEKKDDTPLHGEPSGEEQLRINSEPVVQTTRSSLSPELKGNNTKEHLDDSTAGSSIDSAGMKTGQQLLTPTSNDSSPLGQPQEAVVGQPAALAFHPMSSANIRQSYKGIQLGIVIGIDVGTTFSGVSYAILRPGQVPDVLPVTRFSGSSTGAHKIPSVIFYDDKLAIKAIGPLTTVDSVLEDAEDHGWFKSRRFKMHLRPRGMPLKTNGLDIGDLPPGKSAEEVMGDFLHYLLVETARYIQMVHADGADLWSQIEDRAIFVLGHPNGWTGREQQRYRNSAILGGLVPDTVEGRMRVKFVTEGEASALACLLDITKQ